MGSPGQLRVRWNGKEMQVAPEKSFLDVAKELGWSREVLMVDVNGVPRELRSKVEESCEVKPLGFESREARDALRHTAAHVLAQAVKRLYPDAQLGIGPAIEDGFYYDFKVSRPFEPEDLSRIEEEMKRIVQEDLPVLRREVSREEAYEIFSDRNEVLKLEILDEIPEGDSITVYQQGEFIDLCAGPHVPSTGYVRAFKLTSVAGAYWRGDEKRDMLQRVYGTAFMSREELDEYLRRQEEMKQRDHRKLGRELGIFSIQEEGGPGLVYWHPKGGVIRQVIEDFWRQEHRRRGYDIVFTPHIAKLDLWKTSGHWDWYRENMYSPIVVEGVEYLLKPMNCPFHILMYKSSLRSYRDLPLRWAELGTVYRYERSGVLHGMLRVRGFTQDDAHIFCRPDQLEDELVGVLDLAEYMLKTFGYEEYDCMLSVRDPANKKKYIGDDSVWAQAEAALESALRKKGLRYVRDEGEAKFYGPAIDIKIKDVFGRGWQGPTIQVDFNLPERFDMTYIGEDGRPHRPVMIHRTVLGAMERFVGGLIEHYGGAFPVWLAPVQVKVIPVTEAQDGYAKEVLKRLKEEGIRAEGFFGPEKVGYKIRQCQLEKIPYMLVVGAREQEAGTVAVRHRSRGDLGPEPLDRFCLRIKEAISNRTPD